MKKIIILIFIVAIVLIVIFSLEKYFNIINNNIPKNNFKLDDTTEIEENISNELYPLQNPGLAFEAYWAINRLSVSSYSKDAMLGILDEEYLNYYGLNESNIESKIEKYKNIKYNIVDIKYAYYNSTFLCLVETDENKKFIFRYSEYYKGYTIFLDDYIEDVGYETFVNEKITLILKEEFKGSKYTVLKNISYTDDQILENYAIIFDNFDDLYNKSLTQKTKDNYSYDSLFEIYNDDYSLFGNKFIKINFIKELNEYGLFKYQFEDSKGRKYIINEKSYFNFTIDISQS